MLQPVGMSAGVDASTPLSRRDSVEDGGSSVWGEKAGEKAGEEPPGPLSQPWMTRVSSEEGRGLNDVQEKLGKLFTPQPELGKPATQSPWPMGG